MTSYVVYRAPKESKDRSIIPRRLKALGCKQLHEALWKFDEAKTYKVLRVLEKNQPILLKRTREIRRPQFAKNGQLSELGSVVVVMYATSKDINRVKIIRHLSRAPCLRLRRSVYAFLQKHSLFDKDHELVDARRFVEFIDGNNGYLKAIPRLVIEDADSIEYLLRETHERVKNRLDSIVGSCKELYEMTLKEDDLGSARDALTKNKRRFVTLKKVATFYEKWLGIDSSSSLRRAYKAIKRVSSVIKERQVTKLNNVNTN